jgi:hypothetical protein
MSSINKNIEFSLIGDCAFDTGGASQQNVLKRKAACLLFFCLVVGTAVILSSCAPVEDQSTVTPMGAAITPIILATNMPQGTPVSTVVVGTQRYESSEFGFWFDYPAAWKTYTAKDASAVHPIGAENMIVGVTQPGSNFYIRMALTVETGGPDSYTDDQYRQFAQMLDQGSPSKAAKFQKISDNIITIGGLHALEYIFKYDPQLGTGMDEIRQISVVRNGNAFTLSCGAPADQFDTINQQVFDLIINSFQFK